MATILSGLNYSTSQIAEVLQSDFGEPEQQVAKILNDIGESPSAIAGTLESLYNQGAGAVANVLSGIGLSNSEIDSIGGDFSSFGSSVKSVFSSAWHKISSWF